VLIRPYSRLAVRLAKGCLAAISGIRLIPHVIVLLGSPKRQILWKDLDRYGENYDTGAPETIVKRIRLFVNMMTFYPEYRNVFYLRHRFLGRVLTILCRPMSSLSMNIEKCGAGLFIHHGFGTLISAKEVGDHCSIGQLVTIGYVNNSVDRPIIGNNVTISVGARVLGAVKVGDNSFVSANSVVLANVPPGSTAVGVPAKTVWRKENS